MVSWVHISVLVLAATTGWFIFDPQWVAAHEAVLSVSCFAALHHNALTTTSPTKKIMTNGTMTRRTLRSASVFGVLAPPNRLHKSDSMKHEIIPV